MFTGLRSYLTPIFSSRIGNCLKWSLLLCLSLVCFVQPLSALTINMTDVGASPMTTTQLNAFTLAAGRWESTFSDPITVNINISIEPLDDDILGSARTARTTASYSTVRAALIADAAVGTEKGVMNSLPLSSIQLNDINGNRSDALITLSTANAKALGLGTGLDTFYPNPPAGIDAEIRFSTGFASSFDYDPTDGIPWNKRDFIGIAMHEIGHALGFFSVTDSQDINPGSALHPSTLDLFRFAETGGSHSITTSIRKVINGGAEYFDTSLNNVPLSHGAADSSDPACNTVSGACQASHWSDDQGNLMDASLRRGLVQTMKSDDRHALDYCGYNRKYVLLPAVIRRFRLRWFWPRRILELPQITEGFEGFAEPPPPEIVEVPKNANLVFRAGFDLGYEGGEKRSGLGYAVFNQIQQIDPKVLKSSEPIKGEEYLDPPGEPAQFIPQNLSLLFIQSDLEGVPFTFRSTCPQNGCPFDPAIGKLGGYRVPGFMDGEGDKQVGDVDGIATLILAVSDTSGQPDPDQQNYFENDEESQDGNIIVYDPQAIGMVVQAFCGDAQHPRPMADINGDCIVDFKDVAFIGMEWLKCTAPVCP